VSRRLRFDFVEPMDAAEEEQLRVDVARWTQEFIEDKLADEDNPQADFKIGKEDREELGDAITRARDAYWGPDSGAHRRALADLDKHLLRVVESLTVLRFWLTDEITICISTYRWSGSLLPGHHPRLVRGAMWSRRS
jgi:hypothetical protein